MAIGKKTALFVGGLLCSGFSLAGTSAPATCIPGQPQTSNGYEAVKWYRDSAERSALYREVFLLGEEQIKQTITAQQLKRHQWGVIFDLDETVFDDSAMYKQKVLNCQAMNFALSDFTAFEVQGIAKATPGAVDITCNIQKMGGYVSFISNRNGDYTDSQTGRTVMQATLQNLKNEGICFDQVILMNRDSKSMDKNPRFQAVSMGMYAPDMVYNTPLPEHQVVAYFDDNIQDFPSLYQADVNGQDPNGAAYAHFGSLFFILPNPMYGSWQANDFQ